MGMWFYFSLCIYKSFWIKYFWILEDSWIMHHLGKLLVILILKTTKLKYISVKVDVTIQLKCALNLDLICMHQKSVKMAFLMPWVWCWIFLHHFRKMVQFRYHKDSSTKMHKHLIGKVNCQCIGNIGYTRSSKHFSKFKKIISC